MPNYDVTIPNWHVGASMTIGDIPADTPDHAKAKVLAWVNSHFAPGQKTYDRLPEDTRVWLSTDQPTAGEGESLRQDKFGILDTEG